MSNVQFAYYRISISWARILPKGFANEINEEGIQYYIDLLKEISANGIEPVVTLYHWDHPRIFEEMGGWTNELMVQWFGDYARVVFQRLGHLVKTFNTINEPHSFCLLGYRDAIMAPGVKRFAFILSETTLENKKLHKVIIFKQVKLWEPSDNTYVCITSSKPMQQRTAFTMTNFVQSNRAK